MNLYAIFTSRGVTIATPREDIRIGPPGAIVVRIRTQAQLEEVFQWALYRGNVVNQTVLGLVCLN